MPAWLGGGVLMGLSTDYADNCSDSCGETGPVTFIAANDLVAPVTLSVDGSPYAILSFGRTTQITLPANARLTWTSSKPADAHGEMIADEIGVIKVDVSAITGALEITNVI